MRTNRVQRSTSMEPDDSGPETASSLARGAVVAEKPLLSVDDLGWTPEEAADTRARPRPFEEDRNAPEMDAYDDR